MVITSRFDFAQTVDHLTQAIASGGNTVFATIDQAAAARSVGLAARYAVTGKDALIAAMDAALANLAASVTTPSPSA